MKGILLLAYGGPGSLDDVPAFLGEVRGGRPYSQEFLAAVTHRYRSIGGGSPLPSITRSIAAKVAAASGLPVYVGMLHWPPMIEEAVAQMADGGIAEALAICLTPQYSGASVGRYRRRVAAAAEARGLAVELVEQWHTAVPYLDGLAASVRTAWAGLASLAGVPHIVFSAHSLPKVALPAGDPYEAQLRQTAALVAERLGVSADGWTLAYQSISGPAGEWLGPSVEQIVRERAEHGEDAVVVCPFGFLMDQVEVLYDLDIALKDAAAEWGVTLLRTPLLNDGPAVVYSLMGLVERWQA